MAYGRKDYFWGVAPEKPVFGELQTPFTKTAALQITDGGEQALITHELSTGYILNITGCVLGSDSPGIVRWDLKVEGVMQSLGHFDTFANIILNQGGEVVVGGGETLIVNIYNLTQYQAWFTAYVYGFLQQTVV